MDIFRDSYGRRKTGIFRQGCGAGMCDQFVAI